MKKKPAKKAKSMPEYDSQRQQNVLLEKIYTEVKTVGEGHSGLNRRMDGVEDRLGGIDQRLDLIDSRLVRVDNKLIEHDKRFDRIEMVVTENRKDIKVLQIGQQGLQARQEALEVGQQGLQARQEALEVGQQGLQAGQEALETGQKELKGDIKRIEHKLDTITLDHEQRIQKLESVK